MDIVIMVYAAPPVLGGGYCPSPSVFSFHPPEENFIKALSAQLKEENMSWQAHLDDSYSDIDELMYKAKALVCAPGLQYQFRTKSFDKSRILYLTTMEYFYSDTRRVIEMLRKIDATGK